MGMYDSIRVGRPFNCSACGEPHHNDGYQTRDYQNRLLTLEPGQAMVEVDKRERRPLFSYAWCSECRHMDGHIFWIWDGVLMEEAPVEVT